MGTFLLTILMFVGIFLMFVILIQRGRGGGLAGAFGGLGGQSAFGTKAGDVFTVITIVTAVIWVILACVAGAYLRSDLQRYGDRGGQESISIGPDGNEVDDADADPGEDSGVKDSASPDAEKGPASDASKAADEKATETQPATDETPSKENASQPAEKPASE